MSNKQLNGIIVKGIGGFYYVEAAGAVYECKARGVFRQKGLTPLPGDNVTITVTSDDSENTVDAIGERKTLLQRPPVANIDRLFIVTSVCNPSPNLLVIDRLTAIAQDKGIEPVLVITKTDLASPDSLVDIYRRTGIETICVSGETGENAELVKRELEGHISAFSGNTGVGKSTLLNSIDNHLQLQTGEISRKLGRGKHTTRHVELFRVNGGYVADTPGFSSLANEIEYGEFIKADNIPFCFKEFLPYLGHCKFSTCTHVSDKGCKIIEAVQNGTISASRHESYVALYNEAKRVKDWQLK